jgi:hypothetical protein
MKKLQDPFVVAAQNAMNITRGLTSAVGAATSLRAAITAINDESLTTEERVT